MYLSSTRSADAAKAVSTSGGVRRRVAPTVLALGAVSLLTDVSAEMVLAVLPLYVIHGLGLSYAALGALDSLYTGATAVLRLVGGWVADRWQRPKAVATVGYAASAASKALLPLAGSSLPGLTAVIAFDRAGKGIRTAPRDALIAAASRPSDLAHSFGVHRAMDTCGALLGPLVAFGLLALLPGDYDAVFVVSCAVAVIGVVLLVATVPSRPYAAGPAPDVPAPGAPADSEPEPAPALRLRDGVALVARPGMRRLVVAAALLGACTIGDLLLFLAVQQQTGMDAALLPLLPLGTAAAFMLAAVPLGRLADRVGRWRLYLAAHLLFVGLAFGLAAGPQGWPFAIVALALHGVFYAATDGVLMAHAAPLVPARLRATGLAAVQTAQVLARSLGALAFGVLAASMALTTALVAFGVALAVALTVVAVWLGPPDSLSSTSTSTSISASSEEDES